MKKESIADAEIIPRPYGIMKMLAGGKQMKSLNVDLRILEIRAGEATTRHHHVRSESVFHILHGTLVMEVGSSSRVSVDLSAGDTIFIEPGEIHCLRNVGDDEGVVVEAMGPPFSQRDIFYARDGGL